MGFLKKTTKTQQNQQNLSQSQPNWVPLQPINQQVATSQQYQSHTPQRSQNYYMPEQSSYGHQPQIQGYAPQQNGLFPPQQSQVYTTPNQQPMLNAQQYGASPQSLFGNVPPQYNQQQYTPIQPNFMTEVYQSPGPYTNPRLHQLEQQYKGFKHYPIANLVFIAIAVIALFSDLVNTLGSANRAWLCDIYYMSSGSRNNCRSGQIGYAISSWLQTLLIAGYLMITITRKVILCGIYFFGKRSYDTMDVKNLRLLMIVCGLLSVGSILTLSIYQIGHFAYLAFCAWRLRGLAQEITTLKSALLA